ncbi:Protein SHOOT GRAVITROPISM 5 [Capsicum annuum]|nr:zinc finger protein SHOOT GRAVITROPISM 5 [Capsicum annuum]KAF3674824.1 Protein SHOOT GRAVITROPISM 5 [Capsicum annuum]
MLASHSFLFGSPSNYSDQFSSPENGFIIKRKRRPAGTPDPDAQVVYLTAEMLMESDRYVCEICNLSFQREQNLQMHRRRHKVPWKLKKKRDQEEEKNEMDQVIKKRVYVCPEPSCVHHDPCHALGDLVGIKKHFRRKHSNYKQWICQKCNKGYAVQSDYKAHIKTCGTRGHSCDCGRVFSRVETFIEHQDSCKPQSSTTTTTTKECHDVQTTNPIFLPTTTTTTHHPHDQYSRILPNLDLELFTSPNYNNQNTNYYSPFEQQNEHTPQSNMSSFVGQSHDNYIVQNNEAKNIIEEATTQVSRLKSEANEILKIVMEEKAMAEEKRQEAKCLIELANLEMAKAREITQSIIGSSSSSHVMKIIKCSSCTNLSNYLSSSIYRR